MMFARRKDQAGGPGELRILRAIVCLRGGSDAGPGSTADGGTPSTTGDAGDAATPCEGDKLGFSISNVARCEVPAANARLDLGGVTEIDTTEGKLTTAGGTITSLPGSVWKTPEGAELRIVAASTLSIPAGTKIAVTGTRQIFAASNTSA